MSDPTKSLFDVCALEEQDRAVLERLMGMLHELPRREKEAVLAGASFANEVERLRAHVAALHELLREWCELGDLPSGGYGGTLRYRTEAELGRLA